MSRNPLTSIADINAMGNGPMEQIAMKGREGQLRQRRVNAQIGKVTTNQPRVAVNIGEPQVGQSVQVDPMTFQVRNQQDPQSEKLAQFKNEIDRMFTPVEKGGSLITTNTPIHMVGGSLPEGYSAGNIPQAIRAKMQLPDGVRAIGFHPGRMTDMQLKAMDYFNEQRDAERQAEADKAQLASNPQPVQ